MEPALECGVRGQAINERVGIYPRDLVSCAIGLVVENGPAHQSESYRTQWRQRGCRRLRRAAIHRNGVVACDEWPMAALILGRPAAPCSLHRSIGRNKSADAHKLHWATSSGYIPKICSDGPYEPSQKEHVCCWRASCYCTSRNRMGCVHVTRCAAG